MLPDDDTTDKRPAITAKSPASYGHNGQNGDNIIERTKLSLPSLSGLDQTPLSSPPTMPATSTAIPLYEHPREEATLPHAQIPDVSASDIIARPLHQREEATLPHAQIPGPQYAHTQTINQPARKRRFPYLLLTLCLLSFGAGAFICAYINPPAHGPSHELAAPHAQQRSTIPLANALLGNGSFRVGEQPTFILHGHGGNVTVAATNTNMITVKTSGKGRDHSANGDNQGINYSRSYDGQRHDVITMTIASGQIDTIIEVPASTKVQIAVDSGSISVTGVSEVNIDTTSGNLDIEEISKSVRASTTNGDITARNLKGQVEMETVNGSIRATTIAGQVQAITQNGDVILREAALKSQSTLKTTYGSVYFSGTIDPQGTYALGTHSGNVNLTLPDNTPLQLHARTSSGSVYSELGQSINGAQVTINVGNGSITARKAI